jgi:hypothetical protein
MRGTVNIMIDLKIWIVEIFRQDAHLGVGDTILPTLPFLVDKEPSSSSTNTEHLLSANSGRDVHRVHNSCITVAPEQEPSVQYGGEGGGEVVTIQY